MFRRLVIFHPVMGDHRDHLLVVWREALECGDHGPIVDFDLLIGLHRVQSLMRFIKINGHPA